MHHVTRETKPKRFLTFKPQFTRLSFPTFHLSALLSLQRLPTGNPGFLPLQCEAELRKEEPPWSLLGQSKQWRLKKERYRKGERRRKGKYRGEESETGTVKDELHVMVLCSVVSSDSQDLCASPPSPSTAVESRTSDSYLCPALPLTLPDPCPGSLKVPLFQGQGDRLNHFSHLVTMFPWGVNSLTDQPLNTTISETKAINLNCSLCSQGSFFFSTVHFSFSMVLFTSAEMVLPYVSRPGQQAVLNQDTEQCSQGVNYSQATVSSGWRRQSQKK